ncbi:aldehyde dehydrogenase family protein [Paraburkholderia sp. SOS3]|uniref:aldehyde dehydrogenase family protein n=1 Tax=Paraburkholderia sp. SOS3 TaxID=1926494 RepID=UPI0009473836|nr:aldehyde dehydrogenase family protein [Paraburkholderia sp. SOS3]APR35192.1 aldehyde dehydrogenase family protein [Paraburkholderia sp. SOS3]
MQIIEHIYVDGSFVVPHGSEMFDLFNPATEQVIGRVRLADEHDANRAVAAAKRALVSFSRTSKSERLDMLQRILKAIQAKEDELTEASMLEFGAPAMSARFHAKGAATMFEQALKVLREYDFKRRVGSSEVVMQPVGVAALITPWNANAIFIAGKLSVALAAGCTAVLKPSEMSATQTRVMTEALHDAGLPAGVVNIVTGRGDVVGETLSAHPDVAKISFTGSTAVGKRILRTGAETLKRTTLELGGKSPFIILDDADLATAAPVAVQAGFTNGGQACNAGSRILIDERRLAEFEKRVIEAVGQFKPGEPRAADTRIGPMVSEKQWQRVQRYIRLGLEEGARLLTGGEGRPAGMSSGWFVKPTVFSDVRNDMTIAREEIFGPVLSIIPYRDVEDAIAIANDTPYGLQAYVMSAQDKRAQDVAARIDAGRVLINGLHYDFDVPFGGFKQSGLGRELGVAGLEAYLEPKAVLGVG